uniref:LigA n=1 Tax=Parastrongyloides trichosuri TaxID=131310 RepID=A0A0N4Z8I7_PARTI
MSGPGSFWGLRAGPLDRHRRLCHRRGYGRRHLLLDRSPARHRRAAPAHAAAPPSQDRLDAPLLPSLRRGLHLHRPLLRTPAGFCAGHGGRAEDAPAGVPAGQCHLGLCLGSGHAGARLSGRQGTGAAGVHERGPRPDPDADRLWRAGGRGCRCHALDEGQGGQALGPAGGGGSPAGWRPARPGRPACRFPASRCPCPCRAPWRRSGCRRAGLHAGSCRPARTSTAPSGRRGLRAGRGRRSAPTRPRRPGAWPRGRWRCGSARPAAHGPGDGRGCPGRGAGRTASGSGRSRRPWPDTSSSRPSCRRRPRSGWGCRPPWSDATADARRRRDGPAGSSARSWCGRPPPCSCCADRASRPPARPSCPAGARLPGSADAGRGAAGWRRRPVQDGAGREDARADHLAGLGQFAVGEDLARIIGRVVDGGHAEGQRGVVDPGLLRDDLVRAHRAVPVGIHQAGDDGLAGHVHDAGVSGNGDRAARADGLDAVAVDDDHAVLDDLVALHGDQAGAAEDHAAVRLGVVGAEADLDSMLGGLGQFSRRTLGEGEAFLQRTREQLRSHRPLQAAGIARPVQPFARVAGDAGLGQGLGVGADRDGPAGGDEGRHIGVETLGPGHPVLVRRYRELGRPFAAQVGAFVIARQIDRLENPLVAVARGQEDPVVAGAELRVGALVGDQGRLAAAHRGTINAGLAAPQGRAQEAVAGGAIDDGLTATRGVGDTVPQVAKPQVAEGLEHHLGAVGRGLGPAHHLHVELVRRHLDGEAHGLLHAAGVGDMEGDFADGFRRHVDVVDLAARPEDDALVVRGPAHRRIDAVDGPGFLQVAVQGVVDRGLATRFEVHDVEDGLVPVAPDEGQGLAVGRGGGANRTARAGDEGRDLARLAIQATDHIDLGVRVLGIFELAARRGVVAEVEVAAIGREGGFARVLLLGAALGQLHAAAAGAVVHPHLARAQRARRGEVLAADDELAVRRPVGLGQQAEGLVRHLFGVGAVAIHDPQVVAAAPVRGEGDGAAVRRIFGLHVPGHARGDGAGLAAADGHDIDVAQQVENDLAAVRADVQRHPGALGDVDGGVVRRARRVLDVPLRLVRRGRGGRRRIAGRCVLRERREGHGQGRDGGQQTALHGKPPTPKTEVAMSSGWGRALARRQTSNISGSPGRSVSGRERFHGQHRHPRRQPPERPDRSQRRQEFGHQADGGVDPDGSAPAADQHATPGRHQVPGPTAATVRRRDAGLVQRSGAAAGPFGRGQGVAARRLRHRLAPGRPAPDGPDGDGRGDRTGRGLCLRPRAQGAARGRDRVSLRLGRRHRTRPAGRRPGQWDDGAEARRA